MAQLLHIGTVRRAHGLRGQVKVALDNAESEVLAHVEHLWTGVRKSEVADAAGQLRKWQLHEARPLELGIYLVTLDGLHDRTAAEALQLQDVYADRAEMPTLSDNEVYQADLVGCTVRTQGGDEVGTVRSIDMMNGNLLLVVQRTGRADALVPLVPQIVADIDLAARAVQIDPPEGLLDLDLPGA
jgi:16S rRNA processing protein RimM